MRAFYVALALSGLRDCFAMIEPLNARLSVCFIIAGALTNVDLVQNTNNEFLQTMDRMFDVHYQFIGAAESWNKYADLRREVRGATFDGTYTRVATPAPRQVLRKAYKGREFETHTVPQAEYAAAWIRHRRAWQTCVSKLPPNHWKDKNFARVVSRKAITLKHVGRLARGFMPCNVSVLVRSDAEIRLPAELLKHDISVVASTSDPLWLTNTRDRRSRTDMVITTPLVVRHLIGFDRALWRECPVKRIPVSCFDNWCRNMDLSTGFEVQFGNFLNCSGVLVRRSDGIAEHVRVVRNGFRRTYRSAHAHRDTP